MTAPILIIGGGLAGLFTALKLAPLPVTVITGAPLGTGASSNWAQGGVAAAIGPSDSPGAHIIDTINAGAGLVEADMARILAHNASDRILDLLAFGAPFDHGVAGALELGREAAHSTRRIVKVSGDQAGYAIMQALIAATRSAEHVTLQENAHALELVVENGQIRGVFVGQTDHLEQTPTFLGAASVVLATGGIGQVFATTTNPKAVRGDGLAMAARAGAMIRDAEFVQFHPTALDVGFDPAPLASEALRGEGAILINQHGDRFMDAVSDLGELAARDIVAREVFAQIQAANQPMLDCRKHPGPEMPTSFAKVTKMCLEAGLDPEKDPLPVAPAAHFHMGGVATNVDGRTSIGGLYACGEVACSGVHGANRLAGNSLLEAVVFGQRIADAIIKNPDTPHRFEPRAIKAPITDDETKQINKLRHLMSQNVGVVRTKDKLRDAVQEVFALYQTTRPGPLHNLASVALLVSTGALQRTESRGGHFREDYPNLDPNWKYHSETVLDDVLAAAKSQTTSKNA